MALSIFNPPGDDSPIQVASRVLCKALATAPEDPSRVNWSYSVNGGGFTTFASGTPVAVFIAPAAVVNGDLAGNFGLDVLTLRAQDQSTGVQDTTSLILTQGPAKIPCVSAAGTTDATVEIPDFVPFRPQGHCPESHIGRHISSQHTAHVFSPRQAPGIRSG